MFRDVLMNKIKWVVDKKTDCWNIISHKIYNSSYYPTVYLFGKKYYIHRAMYIAINGKIPNGLIVRHKCDNSLCVNPEHLLLGTKKDNTQDMLERNRENKWKGGRENHKSDKRRKLSIKQIKDIKDSSLSSYKLAKIYPVSSVQIRRIKNGARCKVLT